jgi:CDP-2,3-bis-(O-geranylgeranyl)-sn-glycerol synthase
MLPTWFDCLIDSEVFNAIFFTLPTLLANVTPMLFGGGKAIDFRKNFLDDKRILGDNKTIRGFLAGCLGGFLMGLFSSWWLTNIIQVDFNIHLVNGFFQGLGAVTGDMVGSFIKRRIDIQPGGSLLVIDQIGFMIFGLFFAYIGAPFPWTYWVIMLPLTLIVHFAANAVGYTIGWKDVWW